MEKEQVYSSSFQHSNTSIYIQDIPQYDSNIEERSGIGEENDISHKNKSSTCYNKFRIYIHLIIWLAITGFVSAAFALQIPKGYDQNLLILGLIYLAITLIFLSRHLSFTNMTKSFFRTKEAASAKLSISMNPSVMTKFYAFTAVIAITAVVFGFPERTSSSRVDRLVPFFGFFAFLLGVFATSVHRRHIQWNTIITTALAEFFFGLFVFRSSVGQGVFTWIANITDSYLHNAWHGSVFWFGTTAANAGTLALSILPAIIFFASTVQILSHLGALQWFSLKFGAIFMFIFGTSGAESVVTVATPFVGSSDNALLLVKPLLSRLTKSELHLILTSGFTLISGSAIYACIAMGVSGQAIVTSNFMGIPGSILISKLRYPETEESVSKHRLELPDQEEDNKTNNIFHAAAKGAEIGMTIVLIILANIIALLAILHAFKQFLTWLGNFLNCEELTLEIVTGYLFIPFAWLNGVDTKDLHIVGRLLAIKLRANEFVAYNQMMELYKGQLSARSELITIFAFCGFANLANVGTQIGTMNALVPKRTGEFSSLAMSALICASISNLVSATIAGMLI